MSGAMRNPDIAKMIRDGVMHACNGTVELVDHVLKVPADEYTDPERFKRERDSIFRQLPLMLAPSCELPNPGDFKSMDVTGVPVLLVRGQDGKVRAFVNSCSHRGASVVDAERGNARRFTCSYHGWTFGQKGELIGVASPKDFGEIDKSCHGLPELMAAERAGLIFVTLNQQSTVDIDDFLAGFDKLLDQFNFKDWHFFESRKIPSANWKIAHDATIDYYHVPVLHKNTLAASGEYSNRALYYQAWGPHQRMLNPDSRIKGLSDLPESEWSDAQVMGGIWSLFPNVTITGFNSGFVSNYGNRRASMIMYALPGDAAGTSVIHQIYLLEKKPEDDAIASQAHAQFEFLGAVVRDEDNKAGLSQQKALETGLVSNVLFGRNEGGCQHFHQWVNKVIEAERDKLNQIFTTP